MPVQRPAATVPDVPSPLHVCVRRLRGLRPTARRDMLVAVTLWALLVPQGLAYGELAGLSPVAGLYTATAALLLYPLLGSSRYLQVGPESSVAILTAASLAPLAKGDPGHAAALAGMLALLTAAFLVVGAVLRLGVVARLLSTPVLLGYLAGSAVIIAASQATKVTGVPAAGGVWWRKLGQAFGHLDAINWWSVALAGLTVVIVVVLRRFAPAVPAFLVALAAATVVCAVHDLASVHGVAVVGRVRSGLPTPSVPSASLHETVRLLTPALSIALLVFASSILTGSALAVRDHERVSPKREFLGLAAACAGSSLMHGFPANASDTRSFAAADGGSRSGLTSVTAGLMTIVTLLFLTPLFVNLPQAALGAVVIVTVVGMVDVAALRRLRRARVSDFVLAAVTCGGVLALGVLPGIAVGVAVSLLEVLRRTMLPPTAVLGMVHGSLAWRNIDDYERAEARPGVLVFRFDAPLFFANAEVFRDEVQELVSLGDPPVHTVVINAEGIVDLDVTGADVLAQLVADLRTDDVQVLFARVRSRVLQTLTELHLVDALGAGSFYLRVEDAVTAVGLRTRSPSPT